MNDIQTWQQGRFIDQRQYALWAQEDKDRADSEERHLVRPAPTENAICSCPDPSNAKWIAQRLNLASTLEQMTYDFATGKTDGSEIVRLVQEKLEQI